MDMDVSFPGGKKVNASFLGFEVATDQTKKQDGEETAPTPFALFFASMATCAGYYVLKFCQKRDISMDGIRLTLHTEADEKKKMVTKVEIKIIVPPDFPEKYHQAVVRAADQCTVKKHLVDPPVIETTAVLGKI